MLAPRTAVIPQQDAPPLPLPVTTTAPARLMLATRFQDAYLLRLPARTATPAQ